MSNPRGHSYRLGARGRSISTAPGVTNAHLACSEEGCGRTGRVKMSGGLLPPDQIDRKFAQLGWRLDPHVCPACIALEKKEKKMTAPAKPVSTAAMKAQADMFRHLSDRFDTVAGRYEAGWNDERIAKETGIAKTTVVEFRKAGFGEIKEDPAIADIRADINALEDIQREHAAGIAQQIAELRTRLGKIAAAA